MKDIIKEFIEGTPTWYERCPEEFRNRPCITCGVRPEYLKKLADEMKKQSDEIVAENLRRVMRSKTGY